MSAGARQSRYDAIIIGSGPNGLAAAITLAREGCSVLVIEGHAQPGGGARTAELTLPGFYHDVCSAIHPMGAASPFMRSLPLDKFGLEWIHPETLVAHPLDGGRAAVMKRSLAETAALLGVDGPAWSRLMGTHVREAEALWPMLLGPVTRIPRHPLAMTSFGLKAMRSGAGLARGKFRTEEARALLAGNAAHSVVPLEFPFSAAIAMALGVAGHSTGWPVARGGTGMLTQALCRYLEALGGEIICGWTVKALAELPASEAVLFDTGPRALAEIAGAALPGGFTRRLQSYRYGPAAFKLDMALSGPIPWTHAGCHTAGTVHVGGNLEEIGASERAAWKGKTCARPFVLVAQQSICDPTRAPAGRHTAWAYCHVPAGSTEDASEAILSQIERFAPGFRDTIMATHRLSPAGFAEYNPNNVNGDVVGGAMDPGQLFTRPLVKWNPYTTPNRRLYLCSSSTPPGGGVHGMCGWHAARTALRKSFGRNCAARGTDFPPPHR